LAELLVERSFSVFIQLARGMTVARIAEPPRSGRVEQGCFAACNGAHWMVSDAGSR
jgi:hypothetical protein